MGYHDDGTESYYGDEPDGEDPRGNRTSDFDSDFRAYHGTSRASHSNRNRTRKVSRRGPPDSSTARTFTRGTPDRRATDPTPGRKATVEDPLEHLKESKWAAIANRHIDLPPPDQHQSSLSARSSFKTRGDGSRVATIGVHREADAKLVIELDEETFTVGLDGRSRCFTVPCTTLVYQMNTRVTYDTSSRSAEEEDQWLANLNVFQVLDKMYPRIPQIIKEKMSEDAIEQALGWRDEVIPAPLDPTLLKTILVATLSTAPHQAAASLLGLKSGVNGPEQWEVVSYVPVVVHQAARAAGEFVRILW
ncbi:uncharacterized protein L199_005066 [Kwoniella botswanensis]|uniref:uncharacterized protein n=1 Tax=Kwoniella botswanensis TaxID=1268659 RepID=UPI00315C6E7B